MKYLSENLDKLIRNFNQFSIIVLHGKNEGNLHSDFVELINKIAGKLKKQTAIGIRLNPDINAPTHKKISTGKAEDKFGLSKTNLISFCLLILTSC